MRRFLRLVFVWSLLLFLIAAGLDYIISSGLKRTDIRKYAVWNDIYTGKASADVIVLGSSRAWCGYNTYLLDSLLNCNSYNLGIDGHGIDYQIIRYKTYLKYNKKPDLLILNVDFGSTLCISSDKRYEREQFFPYVLDGTLISEIAKDKKITFFDRYLPLYRYIGYHQEIINGIKAFWGDKNYEDGGMHKGYRGNNYAWSPGLLSTQGITDVAKDIDDTKVTLLRDFLCRLKDEGTDVIMVKAPFFRPLFDKISGVSVSDSIFLDLAQTYNILLFDYYYSDCGKDSANFYNPSHLNAVGSEIFTKQLCGDIDSCITDMFLRR